MNYSHLSSKLHSFRQFPPAFAGTFYWLFISLILIFTNLPYQKAEAYFSEANSGIQKSDFRTGEIKVLSSDESGVTLELNVSELKTEVQQLDGVRYQSVSYAGSVFASEVGNPRVPVSRILLGAPPEVTFRIQILDDVSDIRRGYRLPPAPRQIVQTSKDIETTIDKYDETGTAYRRNRLYPKSVAEVIYDGYIREQRVISVELRPVQYTPKSRTLKVHSRLVVRVVFDSPAAAAPSFRTKRRNFSIESKAFEDFYRKKLVNYDSAKNWRKQRPLRSSISAAPQKMESGPVYKIFIEKTGIYRLTYDDLQSLGADLSSIDPRKLILKLRQKQIPIYIHGESDGRFDRGDYIEFLGQKPRRPDSIYTRWNVYWLSVNSSPGFRVAQLDGTPDDPTGIIVSSFNSKLNFEQDHFHQVLQHVSPEEVSPNDPDSWFEARDHWFWTGIKNGSDRNEVELKFRLYDVAKTLERPKIELLLQGGTPTEHDVLVSINGIKMADAKWNMQDEISLKKYLRSQDELVDATKGFNIIRCARIDTTTEENTLSYPYHIYINSFNVEYIRLLKAVDDYLLFASPRSAESYEVRKRRKLEYTVQGFLNPNIDIFETDGSVLLAKIRNPAVKQAILTREEKERLRVILQDRFKEEHPTHSFAEEEQQFAAPPAGAVGPSIDNKIDDFTINVPNIAYNATFQYPDTHDAQFIAVSEVGLLKPARIVMDENANLKDTSNGADYIIITHPVFMEYAKRLGEWRKTPKGGNYRVKVVDVTEIYDEFNYGMVSPRAIKDFLTYAYFNWQQPAVSYVVIFGDGTFDFLGIDKKTYPQPPELSGYIPTHYVWTTYGDTSSDQWYTTVSGIDVLPDFFIGRIPVETGDEAEAVVDKIINYEGNRPNGPWRRRIISIADDDTTNSGDFIFKKSLNEISQNHTLLGFETTKIFLEDIMKMVNANPAAYKNMLPGQVARGIITEELSKGAVMAQYAGHGGRVVWAHEIIFDNYAAKKLEQTDKLPFLLVLSCYNGYFDKPGTPSIAETLLRLPKAGVIGMLSATRLTYGSGNDALNKIIFDDIFKRNMRGLGEIAFNSKLELLIADGYGQFEVMQQYTLFGDPATKMAMADYEITPEIQTPSVKPGDKLRLAPGRIFRSIYDEKIGRKRYLPVRDFNGKLYVTVKFPGEEVTTGPADSSNGVSIQADVSNGEYPVIELRVPINAKSGKGVVEYYAENKTKIAVGGTVFSVEVPKIVDIVEEVMSKSFRIAAKVADDLQRGGIKEVTLEWQNPENRQWINTPMNPDPKRGDGWYATEQPLPIPENGGEILYQIFVVDVDNNRAESQQRSFRPLVIPNLRVVYTLQNKPLIYYTSQATSGNSTIANFIKVEIENIEDVDIAEPVEVYIYDGNPDQNEDNIPDDAAKLLGHAIIQPNAWQRASRSEKNAPFSKGGLGGFREGGRGKVGERDVPRAFRLAPLNLNRIAVAEIQYTLPPGRHAIFAWIDPEFKGQLSGNPVGKIKEEDETDNLTSRLIEVNDYPVETLANTQAHSLDEIFRLNIFPKSINSTAMLSLESVKPDELPKAINQPGVTAVTLPETQNAAAYKATLSSSSLPQIPLNPLWKRGHSSLNAPAMAELKFDIDALRQKIKREIGLGEIPDSALDDTQKASLRQTIEDEAKGFAIYLWQESAQKWVRLDSSPVLDSKGNLLKQAHPVSPSTQNMGSGTISDVKVDNEKTPEGTWVLMFTSDNQYRLFLSEPGGQLKEIVHNVDIFQIEPFQDDSRGISITVTRGDKLFQFGDILRFDTLVNIAQGRQISVAYSRDENEGDGVIQYLTVDEKANTPVDKWVILFVDSSHFQLEGKLSGLVKRNGQPLLGTVGEEFFDPTSGLRFKIIAGETPFALGDRFTFETKEVGAIRAKTQHLGIFSIMRSADITPPDIQFSIGNQNFADGDPVSSNPQIQALIADDNGVDLFIRKPQLSISYNDSDFTPIAETEYLLNIQPGSNQATLNYSPTLEVGKYELQLLVYDVDGNSSKKSVNFQVRKTLQLSKVMNYPNPFPIYPRRGTTITFEMTAEADEVEVKIYTISGRLIRILQPDERIGFIMAYWDGRDEEDDEVANGVYYGKITVKKEGQKDLTEYVKMMKLK